MSEAHEQHAGVRRHVGLTGLATMGQNLARNIARHGFPIAVHNRTTAKTTTFLDDHGDEGDIVGCATPVELVGALARPRSILLMVKAGAPVDEVIDELRPLLDAGDLIIDAGNSDHRDTARRQAALADAGLRFLGCGVSGGEDGALQGPSMMPGGSRAAYDQIADVLTAIAASVDDTPCCTYIGDGGAGHFVKMVHNGIEYADMQLIAEADDLLRNGAGLPSDELAATFDAWNDGELDSFLVDITAAIFRRREDDGGDGWLVDAVSDRAEQKGTGRLTVGAALDVGSPASTIGEAVFARVRSSLGEERVAAAAVLAGPPQAAIDDDRAAFVDDVRQALYASKIVADAQGCDVLRRGGTQLGWPLDLAALATIWRGGCIIRARFLDLVRAAYADDPDLANLMLAPSLRTALADAQVAWRRVVADGVRLGIPVPVFSAALAAYDGYRRERLPASLIQAQRDLFGAHTYRRIDRDGVFHSDWATAHQPEGDQGRVEGQQPYSR